MKTFWIKSLLAFLFLFPISVFLHETGHWIIYELNGVESWISFQRANLVNPDLMTEDIFFKSLFGGPVLTAILGVSSLIILTKYPNSIWLFVLGLINATFRILPTIIGMLTAFKTDLKGISDEGNIMLRLFDNAFIRELLLTLILIFYLVIIIKLFKTFRFPEVIRRKKLFVLTICFLTLIISLTYPLLDSLIFGI